MRILTLEVVLLWNLLDRPRQPHCLLLLISNYYYYLILLIINSYRSLCALLLLGPPGASRRWNRQALRIKLPGQLCLRGKRAINQQLPYCLLQSIGKPMLERIWDSKRLVKCTWQISELLALELPLATLLRCSLERKSKALCKRSFGQTARPLHRLWIERQLRLLQEIRHPA